MEISFLYEPFYVGKGTNNRYKPSAHLSRDSNVFLLNKIRKIGETNIKIFREENFVEKEAFDREQFWIETIGRKDLGLGTLCNLSDGGENCPTGVKRSDETKRKISAKLLGHSVSEETREKQRRAKDGKPLSKGFTDKWTNPARGKDHHNFGKPVPLAQREKISQSLRGENHPQFGKPLSEIHRQNISKALTGKPKSVAHKAAISTGHKGQVAWNKGSACSEKTKAKIKETFRLKKLQKLGDFNND